LELQWRGTVMLIRSLLLKVHSTSYIGAI